MSVDLSRRGWDMAYSIVLNDLIEVRIMQRISGQTVMNVLHYQVDQEGGTPVTNGYGWLQQLALWVANDADGVVDNMRERTCTAVQYTGVYAQKIRPTRYRAAYAPLTLTGDIPDEPISTQNQARVFSKLTELAVRGGTGSFHLAGFPATDIENGEFTPAVLLGDGQLVNALEASITPVIGQARVRPVVWSGRPTSVMKPILDVEPQRTARVMRRRTVGLGV